MSKSSDVNKSAKYQCDEIQKRLKKSHVLQDGDFNFTQEKLNEGVWETSNSRDFTQINLKTPVFPKERIKRQDYGLKQMDTHFTLGNEDRDFHNSSTSQDDFGRKVMRMPKAVKLSPVVNWSDMAPEFSTDRTTGSTEYTGSFLQKSLKPQAPVFRRCNVARMSLPVDLESVKKNKASVKFGSDPESFHTETGQAYISDPSDAGIRARMSEAQRVSQMMRDMDLQSNVFRSGDYNDYGKEHGSTIFNLDYCKDSLKPENIYGKINEEDDADFDVLKETDAEDTKPPLFPKTPKVVQHALNTFVPEKFKDAEFERDNQVNAHFQFGTDADSHLTVYANDFDAIQRGQIPKPKLSAPPTDSAVLQRDPERNFGDTTASQDFVSQVYQMSQSANAPVRKGVGRNGNNIVLSCDMDRHWEDRMMSLSKSSYVAPPATTGHVIPTKKAACGPYNYLETDVALPFAVNKAKRTESQYNYRGYLMNNNYAIERRKWKNDQTRSRLEEGRGTHFSLGYEPAAPLASEQSRNYTDAWRPADDVPAAGKTVRKADGDFKHFDQSDNTEDHHPNPFRANITESLWLRGLTSSRHVPSLPTHRATVMMNDYQPLKDRKYTPAQLLVLQQNERLGQKDIAPSHLFHLDQPGNKNLTTTTMADFNKPSIGGRKFTSVAAV